MIFSFFNRSRKRLQKNSTMKQAAIKNIASELKLSASTVSRALNDHPDIRIETKRLVNSLAKEPGNRIPGQVGIIGFSNIPITEMINPQLTTVEQPAFEMGRQAAEILINEIESKNKMITPSDIKLETKLIVIESA